MARFHTFGQKFDTVEERFTQSDQENLDHFDTFRGFTINNSTVTKIFVEYTENEDQNNYNIPSIIQDGDDQRSVWPTQGSFVTNVQKRIIFFHPESCIPRIFYGLQPISALRAGIIFVYRLLFGEDDCRRIRCGLAKLPIKKLAPFQKYFEMVKEIWNGSRPAKIQKQMGNTFQVDFLLDIIDNLNVGKSHCLSFNLQELEQLGLNPTLYDNVNEDTRKSHKKSCGSRKDRIPSIQCLLSFHCIMCGSTSKDKNDFEEHLRTCLPLVLNTEQNEQGEPLYTCHLCSAEQMNLTETLCHLVTFCCRNFKDKCPFCQQMGRKCGCTVQRLNLTDIAKDKISKGKQMDIFNHSHRMILHLYSLYRISTSMTEF